MDYEPLRFRQLILPGGAPGTREQVLEDRVWPKITSRSRTQGMGASLCWWSNSILLKLCQGSRQDFRTRPWVLSPFGNGRQQHWRRRLRRAKQVGCLFQRARHWISMKKVLSLIKRPNYLNNFTFNKKWNKKQINSVFFNWNKSNLRQFLKFISVTKFNFSFLITYANHLVIFIQLVWKLLCWPCPSALLGEHSSHRTYLAIWRSWRLSRLSWHHGVLPWPVFVYFKGQFRYWVGAECLIGFGQPIGILLS